MAESGGISHIQQKDKGSSDRPRAEGCPKLKKGDEGAPAGTNRELSPRGRETESLPCLLPETYQRSTPGRTADPAVDRQGSKKLNHIRDQAGEPDQRRAESELA